MENLCIWVQKVLAGTKWSNILTDLEILNTCRDIKEIVLKLHEKVQIDIAFKITFIRVTPWKDKARYLKHCTLRVRKVITKTITLNSTRESTFLRSGEIMA